MLSSDNGRNKSYLIWFDLICTKHGYSYITLYTESLVLSKLLVILRMNLSWVSLSSHALKYYSNIDSDIEVALIYNFVIFVASKKTFSWILCVVGDTNSTIEPSHDHALQQSSCFTWWLSCSLIIIQDVIMVNSHYHDEKATATTSLKKITKPIILDENGKWKIKQLFVMNIILGPRLNVLMKLT